MDASVQLRCLVCDTEKVFRFSPDVLVKDAIARIKEVTNFGDENFGLYRPAVPDTPDSPGTLALWLDPSEPLASCAKIQDLVFYFRSKIQSLNIILIDQSVKVLLVDGTWTVDALFPVIVEKLGISNPDHWALSRPNQSTRGYSVLALDKTLDQQGIDPGMALFLTLQNGGWQSERETYAQSEINELYTKLNYQILNGDLFAEKEAALDLAGIQIQIQYGDWSPALQPINPSEVLPLCYQNTNCTGPLIRRHRMLFGLKPPQAKFRYIQTCRSLPTYGCQCFTIRRKIGSRKKSKMQEWVIALSHEGFRLINPQSAQNENYQWIQLARWAVQPNRVLFDVGNMREEIVEIFTDQADEIGNYVNEAVEAILHERARDPKIAAS